MESDDQFGHWFAGFTDGEGCFVIAKRGTSHICMFVLSLRVDDLPILEEIRDRLKIGKVYFTPPRITMADTDAPKKHRATAPLVICRKSHLLELIAFFDRYPLRAKKRNDYRIWREASMLWIDRIKRQWHNGAHAIHPAQERIAELKAELIAQRQLPYS